MRGGIITSHVALALLCVAGTVFAQAAPPPPPKIWTVTASAGLALTSGNSDTVSINAAYDILYDPQTTEHRQVGRAVSSRRGPRVNLDRKPAGLQRSRRVPAHAAHLRLRPEPVPEGRVQEHRLPGRADGWHRHTSCHRYARRPSSAWTAASGWCGRRIPDFDDVNSSGALATSEKLHAPSPRTRP